MNDLPLNLQIRLLQGRNTKYHNVNIISILFLVKFGVPACCRAGSCSCQPAGWLVAKISLFILDSSL